MAVRVIRNQSNSRKRPESYSTIGDDGIENIVDTTGNQPQSTATVDANGIENIIDRTGSTPQTSPQHTTTTVGPGAASPGTKKVYSSTFVPTELTSHYKNEMLDTEGSRPDPYESRYESTIQDILDVIKNKGKFDLSTDANYKQIFNNYKENYTVQADKAMRDAMASANAATGGYGSTYGQVAGQQAYDATMQSLNDQNITLMQMAYQMYADDVANDYNKLSAFQGQDNIEYGRYRDNVSDWMSDRDYFANQYWSSFQNDRSAYETDRAFEYGAGLDEQDRNDALYDQALQLAYSYTANGMTIPDNIRAIIEAKGDLDMIDGTLSPDSGINNALISQPASGGSTGGSGGGSRKSGGSGSTGKSSSKLPEKNTIMTNSEIIQAINNGESKEEIREKIGEAYDYYTSLDGDYSSILNSLEYLAQRNESRVMYEKF